MISVLANRWIRPSTLRLGASLHLHIKPKPSIIVAAAAPATTTNGLLRLLSSSSDVNQSTTTALTTTTTNAVVASTEATFEVKPPSEVSQDLAFGIQQATLMYLKFGLGKHRLDQIAMEERRVENFVNRWQRMMETFFGTQLHVLAGLGYPPSEKGIGMYNEHLARMLQRADPDMQEQFRVTGRDIYRTILQTTFTFDTNRIRELSIVDARNIMHRVSERMQDPEILQLVTDRVAVIPQMDSRAMNEAMKHNIIQEVMMADVYLGGTPSLIRKCGFGDGEQGYVELQYSMAEHQADPLVAQYVGAGMVKLLQAANVDLDLLQEAGVGRLPNV